MPVALLEHSLHSELDRERNADADTCVLACCAPRPFAVIDIECTGLDRYTHRIVEVAIVTCDADGRPDGSVFHTLINPCGPIDATDIHKITDDDVAWAPTFGEIAGDIIDALSGRTIVAHNAYFDVSFLSAEMIRALCITGDKQRGDKFDLVPVVCTMGSAQLLGLQSHTSLANVCAHTGISLDGAHSAVGDATAAAGILQHILTAARGGAGHVAKFGNSNCLPLEYGTYPGLGRSGITLPR